MPADAAEIVRLAERVEQASGPDRVLDAAIANALGWRKVPNPTFAGGLIDAWFNPEGKQERWFIPLYTASLDAAMSLVPEGWDIILDNFDGRCGIAKAEVTTPRGEDGPWYVGEAATMPLALTAAALRARAAQHDHEVG